MRSGNLRIEQVPVSRDAEGTPAPAYTAWVNTVGEGFYGKPLTGDRLEQMFQAYQVAQRVITAVYDDTWSSWWRLNLRRTTSAMDATSLECPSPAASLILYRR